VIKYEIYTDESNMGQVVAGLEYVNPFPEEAESGIINDNEFKFFVLDGSMPGLYKFQIRAYALGGTSKWFGHYYIKVNCPSTVEVLEFDTIPNGGILAAAMTTFVGSNLGGGGLNRYDFPSDFKTELPKCSKIVGYELVAVAGRESDLNYLSYTTGDCSGTPCN